MRKPLVIIGAVLLVVVIAAAIIPMWVMTAGVSLPGSGVALVVLMIVGCFGVGGGLMFLVFYSARNGYDDAVGVGWQSPETNRSATDIDQP